MFCALLGLDTGFQLDWLLPCGCSILYTRGIYPNDSFKQEEHYGINIMVTKNESLLKYLLSVTKQMEGKHHGAWCRCCLVGLHKASAAVA